MAMNAGGRGIRLRPLDISDVLDELFRVYKQSFVPIITAMAIVVVPSALLTLFATLILLGLGLGMSQASITDRLSREATIALLGAGIGAALIMFLLAIVTSLAQLVAAGALVRVVSNTILGEPISIADAYREALDRFWRLSGVGICVSIPLMLLVVTCLGIPVAVFVGLGWSLVFQAIMLEGQGIFDSMRRSWGLVDGHRWRLLVCFLLIIVIEWFLLAAPSGSLAVMTAGVTAFSDDSLAVQMAMQIVQTVVQAACQVLFTPIGYIGATLIYYDLRVRKEAYDLQQRLPQVEIVQPAGYPQYAPGAPGHSPYGQQPPQYPPQAPGYPPYPQQPPQYPPTIPPPPPAPGDPPQAPPNR